MKLEEIRDLTDNEVDEWFMRRFSWEKTTLSERDEHGAIIGSVEGWIDKKLGYTQSYTTEYANNICHAFCFQKLLPKEKRLYYTQALNWFIKQDSNDRTPFWGLINASARHRINAYIYILTNHEE